MSDDVGEDRNRLAHAEVPGGNLSKETELSISEEWEVPSHVKWVQIAQMHVTGQLLAWCHPKALPCTQRPEDGITVR